MEELDIKTAIQIAKILAAAPDERIPMILDVFSKAQVDINGLDELAEWRALDKQAALIDTDAFVTELTKGKELEDGEYRIRVPEFNHFCSTKGVSARYARKHLYESGMLRSRATFTYAVYLSLTRQVRTRSHSDSLFILIRQASQKQARTEVPTHTHLQASQPRQRPQETTDTRVSLESSRRYRNGS